MLVSKRLEGDWIEIVHRSGDVLRVRPYDIKATARGKRLIYFAFDDPPRDFEIRKPGRRSTAPVATPGPEADRGFEPVAAAERHRAEVDSHADRALTTHAESFAALADDDHDGPDPGDQAVS